MKIDENIPTTSNLTKEDILQTLLPKNEPREIENEAIELKAQMDTEKPLNSTSPSSFEIREIL